MEAVDGPNTSGSGRQSGILSIINRDSLERINTDRSYSSSSSMAGTAIVSPVPSMYSNNGLPPTYSNWPATAHSTSGLVSPPDSRRTSDNKTDPPPPVQTAQPQSQLHRQSLPSIHEALNPKPNPYASPVSASVSAGHQYGQPPAQAGAPLPRTYPSSDHALYPPPPPSSQRQTTPPQPIHPLTNLFARAEPSQNNYTETHRHHSIASLHSGPAHAYTGPRLEPTRYEQDPRAPERAPQGFASHPHPSPHSYGPPPHLPGPQDPAFNHTRFPLRDGRAEETWHGVTEEDQSRLPPFKQGLKRRMFGWDFENCLSSINASSGTLQKWSDHFHHITQEQQTGESNGVPDRMPSIESCNDMLEHQEKIRSSLERMKDMISKQHEHAAMMDQYTRDHGGKGPGGYYEEEMAIYGDDLKNPGYGGPESKKRRGRAAPPGRCHSCNRAETPEWRRGPDGARTLCNACGLHYAKLTRKNTMKQSQNSNGSSLRPKSMDEVSPRPL